MRALGFVIYVIGMLWNSELLFSQSYPHLIELNYLSDKKLKRIDRYYVDEFGKDSNSSYLSTSYVVIRPRKKFEIKSYDKGDSIHARFSTKHKLKEYRVANEFRLEKGSTLNLIINKNNEGLITNVYYLEQSDTVLTYEYQYNESGRLTLFSRSRIGVGIVYKSTTVYFYDANGIITSETTSEFRNNDLRSRWSIIYKFEWESG